MDDFKWRFLQGKFSALRWARSGISSIRKSELGNNMGKFPVWIGCREAQEKFLEENREFVQECTELVELLRKIFIRKLEPPSPAEFMKLDGLPEDSNPVKEFYSRVMADRIVFYMGRIAADDFSELLTLAANGYGFGALKILRSMYEHVVTSAFIAKNPAEWEAFANDSAIKRHKIWKRTVAWLPETAERYDIVQQDWLQRTYAEAISRYKSTVCKKCGQPVTQEAWTRVDLETMAKQTDVNLELLYAFCYLKPLCHSHATAFGMECHIVETEEMVTYRDSSPDEARQACHLAHNLVLRLISLQNENSRLGLDDAIKTRMDKFSEIWDKIHAGEE